MKKTKDDIQKFLKKVQQEKNKQLINQNIINNELESRKNLFDLNILVGFDVSSSIKHLQFLDFMITLDNIKGLSRIKVFEIDSEILAFYDYTQDNQRPISRLARTHITDLTKGFSLAQQIKPDAFIMITDGKTPLKINSLQDNYGFVITDKHKDLNYFTNIISYI